jgi:hypothetical protein
VIQRSSHGPPRSFRRTEWFSVTTQLVCVERCSQPDSISSYPLATTELVSVERCFRRSGPKRSVERARWEHRPIRARRAVTLRASGNATLARPERADAVADGPGRYARLPPFFMGSQSQLPSAMDIGYSHVWALRLGVSATSLRTRWAGVGLSAFDPTLPCRRADQTGMRVPRWLAGSPGGRLNRDGDLGGGVVGAG